MRVGVQTEFARFASNGGFFVDNKELLRREIDSWIRHFRECEVKKTLHCVFIWPLKINKKDILFSNGRKHTITIIT